MALPLEHVQVDAEIYIHAISKRYPETHTDCFLNILCSTVMRRCLESNRLVVKFQSFLFLRSDPE